jgi:uncharacterized Zn-binding protein involved in type VI secretion
MGAPAAGQGDNAVGSDLHLVVQPTGAVVSQPFAFAGGLGSGLSPTVRIGGRAAATVGSTATNQPVHLPTAGAFQRPPTNLGTVAAGSATVRIGGRPAARSGADVITCNDPTDRPAAKITSSGTVRIG